MHSNRAGFTIIEIAIAVTITVLLFVNISMVVRSGSEAYETGAFNARIEAQARQTLDRIELSVIGSSRDSITPVVVAPASAGQIEYEVSLGVQDGEVVWGDPERIEMRPGTGQILWRRNPGGVDEQSVVWSNWVPDLLEGELANGADDNANDLFDERGLSFDMVGDQIVIRLTITMSDRDGRTRTRTLERKVTCRN